MKRKSIDYKNLFESLFYKGVLTDGVGTHSTNSEVSEYLLSCEEIPFEYCEKAFDTKKLSVKASLAIALRKDCPSSMITKMCKYYKDLDNCNFAENFAINLCARTRKAHNRVPDKAFEMIFDMGCMDCLAEDYRIPDTVKKKIIEKMILLDDNGTLVQSHDTNFIVTFFTSQDTIPDSCWKRVDKLVKYLRYDDGTGKCKRYGTFVFGTSLLREFLNNIEYMRKPLSDDLVDALTFLKKNRLEEAPLIMKALNNPSISDYGIVTILAKIEDGDLLGMVNKLLEITKYKRDEYRKKHPYVQGE